jgi:hypothetical protein
MLFLSSREQQAVDWIKASNHFQCAPLVASFSGGEKSRESALSNVTIGDLIHEMVTYEGVCVCVHSWIREPCGSSLSSLYYLPWHLVHDCNGHSNYLSAGMLCCLFSQRRRPHADIELILDVLSVLHDQSAISIVPVVQVHWHF